MPKIRDITDCGTIILDGVEFHSDENSRAIDKFHDHLLSDEVHPDVVLKKGVKLPEYKQFNPESDETFTTKTGKYKVIKTKTGERKVVDAEGNEVSRANEKRVMRQFVDNFDFTHGDKAPEPSDDVQFKSEDEAKTWAVENSNNPAELASIYVDEEPVQHPLSTVEQAVVDFGLKTTEASYNMFGDRNNFTKDKKKNYIKEGALELDIAAQEMSDHYGIEITPQDLVDFIDRFPNGVSEALEKFETETARMAKDKFEKITGIPLDKYAAEKAINSEFDKTTFINSELLKDSYETSQQVTEAYLESEGIGTEDKGADTSDANGMGKEGVPTEEEPPVIPPKPPVIEPEKKEGPYTSVQNSVVNAERLQKNLQPVAKEAKKKFGNTWDEAMHNVRVGTINPRTYVEDLVNNYDKYPITDLTNAYILMDRIDLTNQKMEANERYNKAILTGNENVVAAAFRDLQSVEKNLQQNDLVADKVGTVTGRALSSRRMLAALDYSLVSMNADIAKYYPDGKVPAAVEARLKEIETEHAAAMKKLADYEQEWKKIQAGKKYKSRVVKQQPQAKKKSIEQSGKELADRIRKLRPPSDTAQANFFGLPLAIYDTAIVAIAEAVEKGAKLIDAINEHIKDLKFPGDKDRDDFVAHLKGLEKQSPRERNIDKIKEIAKNANAETITKNMITPLRRIINDYARSGEEDFEKVIDEVHNQLKDSFTDLTKENLRDAYSGYGDVKLDTKKGLQTKINAWKKEAKLLGQIDDVIAGLQPQKEGAKTKSVPSKKLQELRTQLEQKMKEQGISWDNPPATEEEKNARALDSLKSRVQTQIDQLTEAIEKREDLPNKRKTVLDDEAREMIAQRNELKKTLDHILGKEGRRTLSDSERVARAEKFLEKQITDLASDIEKIKAGEYKPKQTQKTPESATLQLMRGRRQALRELKRKLLVDSDKNSSEPAIALEKYKDSIRNRIMEYQRRIEEGDFEDGAVPEKSFSNDAEAQKLELQLKRARVAFQQEKIKSLKENRGRVQKILDTINAWKRFSVLTGIPTIGKLGTAVLWRNVITPIEELTGSALRIIPAVNELAKLAPREGGFISLRAERNAISEWARAKTWEDALRVIKEGQSELDYRFGKYIDQSPEALGVMGRVHGAMKNFAKRNEFARSYTKRMQHAIDHGANPADELTQITAMSQAYIDANRSIFMQDNAIVNFYNRAVRGAEERGNIGAKAAAFLTRFMLPIVKIPTNFVGESLNYTFGSLRGVELAARVLTGHLKDMSPEAADGLMRSLKKGSIGAAAVAIGFFVPGVAGGYYVKGTKKPASDEADYDQIEIAGLRIPKWATHFPLFEAMQLGATLRKVYDRDVDNGTNPGVSFSDGILQASKGLITSVPMFHLADEINEAAESGHIADRFVYPELGSMIPLGIQNIAQFSDVEGGGAAGFVPFSDAKYVKRKPEGPLEQLEYRLPGLRQDVPEK